ncbi:hypothetical protein LCGC14_0736480 [marine sediment metagenome]|uniref:Uncharacterized protein n=1 Tax=marine sediment metagenome TaxID=412755 RepID=A0A0F9Q826_9ZZZZ
MGKVDVCEGRRLFAARDQEPSDWGDWADENAAGLMDHNDVMKVACDEGATALAFARNRLEAVSRERRELRKRVEELKAVLSEIRKDCASCVERAEE